MASFFVSIPGAAAQGIIWGIMAIGVYITYRILDFADLTVDGSFGTGGAAFAMCTIGGMNVYLSLLVAFIAGCLAGLQQEYSIQHSESPYSCRYFNSACTLFR